MWRVDTTAPLGQQRGTDQGSARSTQRAADAAGREYAALHICFDESPRSGWTAFTVSSPSPQARRLARAERQERSCAVAP